MLLSPSFAKSTHINNPYYTFHIIINKYSLITKMYSILIYHLINLCFIFSFSVCSIFYIPYSSVSKFLSIWWSASWETCIKWKWLLRKYWIKFLLWSFVWPEVGRHSDRIFFANEFITLLTIYRLVAIECTRLGVHDIPSILAWTNAQKLRRLATQTKKSKFILNSNSWIKCSGTNASLN